METETVVITKVIHDATPYHGILAEWLRRLIRNQLGTFPREFESLRCRSRVLVAQWIAHQTSNLGVAGSNPVENAFFILVVNHLLRARDPVRRSAFASIAQLAEHLPRKQKVTSSILVGGLFRAVGLEV